MINLIKLNDYWRKYLAIFKAKYFGSTLPLSSHILWGVFHLHMKWIYFFNGAFLANRKLASDFKQKGHVILGKLNSRDINFVEVSSHIESLFLSQSKAEIQHLIRSPDQLISSFVFEALVNFESEIKSILKSEFQTYWIGIYKTTPGKNEPDTSFAWHLDEDPRPIHKIFIYLNDVLKKNGAFRTFDKTHTQFLFGLGFISNSAKARIESQRLITAPIDELASCIEGSAGTTFIFDNNLIHRATYPEEGYRTVISIEIYPSKNKLDYCNVVNSLSMPIVDDFPKNPYVNQYAQYSHQ